MSRTKCAGLLLSYLQSLSRFDAVFDRQWLTSARTSEPIELNHRSIDALLKKGIHKTDFYPGHPPEPIRELGFSATLYSDGYSRASLQAHCGAYTPHVRNSLILSLPNATADGKRIFHPKSLVRLIEMSTDVWDPDTGQVWSHQLSEKIGETINDFQVGWMTYVASRLGPLPELDNRFDVHPIKDLGSIVVATSQRFNINNKHHVMRVSEVAKAFNPLTGSVS